MRRSEGRRSRCNRAGRKKSEDRTEKLDRTEKREGKKIIAEKRETDAERGRKDSSELGNDYSANELNFSIGFYRSFVA